MLIYIIKKSGLEIFTLPSKISGSYWIKETKDNGKDRDLINIKEQDGRWLATSNKKVQIIVSGKKIDSCYIGEYQFILLQFNNCRDHILNLINLTEFANFDDNTLENVKHMLSIYDSKFANLENESFDIHYSEGNINCLKRLKQMKILNFNRKKGRIIVKKFKDNSAKECIS